MYIRTKDGVYEPYIKDYTFYVCKNGNKKVKFKNVIQESENLEALCDEFVEEFPIYKGNELVGKGHHYWKYNKENKTFYDDFDSNVQHKSFINKEFNFYGAIYTDKGLIYIAKMNDKGELELI